MISLIPCRLQIKKRKEKEKKPILEKVISLFAFQQTAAHICSEADFASCLSWILSQILRIANHGVALHSSYKFR